MSHVSSPPTEQQRRIESLEGLRGILASMVVFSHIQIFFFPQYASTIEALSNRLPPGLGNIAHRSMQFIVNGNLAVWTFWILSGLVLSRRHLHGLQVHFGPIRFLATASGKRYTRLAIPVLLSVILCWLLTHSGLMFNEALGQHYVGKHPDWTAYAAWLKDLTPPFETLTGAFKSALLDSFVAYDRATTYNPVLWTIEKEFLGSLLLFAWLYIIRSRKNAAGWSLLLIAGLIAVRQAWAAAFILGMLLNVTNYSKKQRTHWPLLSTWKASACALALLVFAGGHPNYLGLLNLGLGAALIISSLWLSPFRRLLSTRPMQQLGGLSFTIYLIHLPVLCTLSSWTYLSLADHAPPLAASAAASIATLLFTLPVAAVFYRLADLPARKISRAITQR